MMRGAPSGIAKRVAWLLALTLAVTISTLGCGGGTTKPTVSLRLRGTPPDASVTIDDLPVGSLSLVAAHGIALPPGTHRVTVSAPGFFPWDRIVRAEDGTAPIALDVALVPVPD